MSEMHPVPVEERGNDRSSILRQGIPRARWRPKPKLRTRDLTEKLGLLRQTQSYMSLQESPAMPEPDPVMNANLCASLEDFRSNRDFTQHVGG